MRVFAKKSEQKKDDKQRTRARYYPSGGNAKCSKKYQKVQHKKSGHCHAIAPISPKKSSIKKHPIMPHNANKKRASEVNR